MSNKGSLSWPSYFLKRMSGEAELAELLYFLGIGNLYKGNIKSGSWERIDYRNIDLLARQECRKIPDKCFPLRCTTHGKETHIIALKPMGAFHGWIGGSAYCLNKGRYFTFIKVTERASKFYITTKYSQEKTEIQESDGYWTPKTTSCQVTANLSIPEIKKLVGPLPTSWRLRRAITRFFWPILLWHHKTFNVMRGELDYLSK